MQDMFVSSTERFKSENIVSSSSQFKKLQVPSDEAIPVSSTHKRQVMIIHVCYMTNVPYVMTFSFPTIFRVLTQVAAQFTSIDKCSQTQLLIFVLLRGVSTQQS